jgi:RNA polymerase sigma factor (sigma-70 family)
MGAVAKIVWRILAGGFVMFVDMAVDDHELLRAFARNHAEDAFAALVQRHVNLVYSAALRQARSPQLAEEVSQTVFTKLASHADEIEADLPLSAWLYRVTRNAAIDVVRREASRQAREQIAFQMSELNNTAEDWSHIEPLLDEAMEALDAPDRAALLLRYFENKSLREVGAALGASEDAAQKRVSRAIERLREHFLKRKISIGAAGIVGAISANAVHAAPAGLALHLAAGSLAGIATISGAAAAAGTGAAAKASAAGSTAFSKTIAIAMTATQKTVLSTLVAVAGIGFGVYEAREVSNLRAQLEALQRQQKSMAEANGAQVRQLESERDAARTLAAEAKAEGGAKGNPPNEALRLRGEVSRLRAEKSELGATSGLSKATANPEARKMMREQQKMGMSMIYSRLGKTATLTTEQTEKLNDLLADHIMDNVENVTTALRDKMAPEELTPLFGAQESALNTKVQELLGEEGFKQYQDYTKDLLANMSGQQFRSMMTGEDAAKEEKAKQISEILREEIAKELAQAGLPADYQMVPMLNFRNIASESEGEKSLALLKNVYGRATERLDKTLDAAEIAKFKEFQAKAIENNRSALMLNRTMMAPIGN